MVQGATIVRFLSLGARAAKSAKWSGKWPAHPSNLSRSLKVLDRGRNTQKPVRNRSESCCAGLWAPCRVFWAWFGPAGFRLDIRGSTGVCEINSHRNTDFINRSAHSAGPDRRVRRRLAGGVGRSLAPPQMRRAIHASWAVFSPMLVLHIFVIVGRLLRATVRV